MEYAISGKPENVVYCEIMHKCKKQWISCLHVILLSKTLYISAYRKRENDMVSERQDHSDSGTDYDNLSSTVNTDTDDADTTIVEENT